MCIMSERFWWRIGFVEGVLRWHHEKEALECLKEMVRELKEARNEFLGLDGQQNTVYIER